MNKHPHRPQWKDKSSLDIWQFFTNLDIDDTVATLPASCTKFHPSNTTAIVRITKPEPVARAIGIVPRRLQAHSWYFIRVTITGHQPKPEYVWRLHDTACYNQDNTPS